MIRVILLVLLFCCPVSLLVGQTPPLTHAVPDFANPLDVGDRVWVTYSTAWDNLNDVRIHVTAAEPGEYIVGFQFAKAFTLNTEGTGAMPGSEVWSPTFWEFAYQEQVLPPTWDPVYRPADGNGELNGLPNNLGIYKPGEVQPGASAFYADTPRGPIAVAPTCGYWARAVVKKKGDILNQNGQPIVDYAPAYGVPHWIFVLTGGRPAYVPPPGTTGG